MYDLVKAMKALSDETRLRIMHLLQVRECCVCEVMQALQISQTRTSRNLTQLYDAGFLKMRKESLWTLYSLDKDGMPEYARKLVEAVGLALADNEIALKDRERLKTATRISSTCLQSSKGICSKSTIAQGS